MASDGTPPNGGSSFHPAISANGRFVAFASSTNNLVRDDDNIQEDIFVHDRETAQTTRVSVAAEGVPGVGGSSFRPAISADGQFVAFESARTNLVPGDSNGLSDVFVHDRQTGATTRVSVATDGVQANGGSSRAAISASGRFVAFESEASTLVRDDSNGVADVFVHDRNTGITTRASVAARGVQAVGGTSGRPAISANGRLVGFRSLASNLIADDTNGVSDVFVHDRESGRIRRVSVGTGGVQAIGGASGLPAISGSGGFVAFQSDATNLDSSDVRLGVFVHALDTGTTARVSVSSGGRQGSGLAPAITADGRFVAFASSFAQFVPGDTNGDPDIFVHDRNTRTTTRVSVSNSGSQAVGDSSGASISADGRFVAFESIADNLVTDTSNAFIEVFVRDRGAFAGFSGSWTQARIRCTPTRPSRGCTVSGRLEVGNPGNLTAAASRVHFYLSGDRRLGRRDRLLRAVSLSRLRAGATRTVRFRRVLKGDASGRFLIARLDATDKVKEANERDNVVVSNRLGRGAYPLAATPNADLDRRRRLLRFDASLHGARQ